MFHARVYGVEAVAAVRVALLRQVRVLCGLVGVACAAGMVKRLHERVVFSEAVQTPSDPAVVVAAPVVQRPVMRPELENLLTWDRVSEQARVCRLRHDYD